MNFVQGMGVGIVYNFIAAHGRVPARGENVDRILHAAHARLEQPVQWLISLLIISLAALHVPGAQETIQYFGVVPDPASADGKGQQRNSRGGFPPGTKLQGCVATAGLPSLLLATRPEHYGSYGHEH